MHIKVLPLDGLPDVLLAVLETLVCVCDTKSIVVCFVMKVYRQEKF